MQGQFTPEPFQKRFFSRPSDVRLQLEIDSIHTSALIYTGSILRPSHGRPKLHLRFTSIFQALLKRLDPPGSDTLVNIFRPDFCGPSQYFRVPSQLLGRAGRAVPGRLPGPGGRSPPKPSGPRSPGVSLGALVVVLALPIQYSNGGSVN